MLVIDQNINVTRALESLALESAGEGSIFKSAMNLLPTLKLELTATAGLLDRLTTKFKNPLAGFFSFDYTKVDYEALRKVNIPVPEGFVGNALEYAGLLKESLDYWDDTSKPMLTEFYIEVSAFVTNKDRKLSIRDHTKKFKESEASRDQISKDIDKHFTKANVGRAFFTDPYGSANEFFSTMQLTKQLGDRVAGYQLAKVKDEVARLADTLDILVKAAERGDFNAASNESLNNVAVGTFEIAKQVEFFAANYYRVEALCFSVNETKERIKNH